jgi:hypothetical protein
MTWASGTVMTRERVHFIVTKYNLSLYSDPDRRYQVGGDPDRWMEQRFRLFSTFTVPSLMGQSRQDFTWFVFVDQKTPAGFIQQLEDVAAGFPSMRLVPLDRRQVEFLTSEVRHSGARVAITSRIDNDDAWHKDYVRYVQDGEFPLGTLVDFQDSYWLDVSRRELYLCTSRWWTDPRWWRSWRTLLQPRISNSPSTIESAAEALTVLVDEHRRLIHHFRRHRTVQVRDRPYRLVTCHDSNLINEIGGREGRFVKVPPDVLKDFNVGPDYLTT